MNQIDSYNVRLLLLQDPHELASWVNQIDSYTFAYCYFRTPTSLPRG